MRPNLRAVSRRRDEPVRLTRIYTRGGDAGETSLGDGSRVSKLDSRIAAYGAVDELNSQLGLALAAADLPDALRAPLRRIQNELFDVGADLSVPYAGPDERLRVTQPLVDGVEQLCDEYNEPLPELKSFVLPGGSEAARAAARRARCQPPRRAGRPRRCLLGRRQPARAGLPQPAGRSPLHPRARGERARAASRSRSGAPAAASAWSAVTIAWAIAVSELERGEHGVHADRAGVLRDRRIVGQSDDLQLGEQRAEAAERLHRDGAEVDDDGGRGGAGRRVDDGVEIRVGDRADGVAAAEARRRAVPGWCARRGSRRRGAGVRPPTAARRAGAART